MLQQIAVDRRNSRLAFLDRLSVGAMQRREHEKIVEYLSDDYSASLRIAANLSSHAKWIPYPFLSNRLKGIADEMRTQAEMIRAKLVELGGHVPQLDIEGREDVDFRQNVRRLVKDMEEYMSRSEILVHQKNSITDAGVLILLDAIAAGMQKEKEEMLNIVMRLS